MEETIDVKALRARFNNKASTSDTSSRDSGSPKSPQPRLGRTILPASDGNMALPRLSPTVLPPRLARPEPTAASLPPRSGFVPGPPPIPGIRASAPLADTSKVKHTGEMLQNMMLRHQGPASAKPPPPLPSQVASSATTVASSSPLPLRQQPKQRSTGEVTPLRRPLPAERPLPLKPRRPPNVNLEPFLRLRQGAPPIPGRRTSNAGSLGTAGSQMSLPGVASPPKLPQRPSKPSRLPHQIASVDIEDIEETYDDIASCEKNESWSDNSSQCLDGDSDKVYESIEEEEAGMTQVNAKKKDQKKAKRQQDQEKKEHQERQKREIELRKNFQLQGEVDVLHTARVRHDWHGGGKLDLSVQQGESVEILRVNNNPGGKWLARSLGGKYGYISNTCVDIDYEAVKRKVIQSRKTDTSVLPPPPPDPPRMPNVELNSRDSPLQDDDDYDDIQDFPPPPPEISIDPRVEKELKKKFKYEGPFRVLHSVMVDPNGIIKKPGSKDLPVTQGEVLEVIQLTNSKKVLCRNRTLGKYGYVPRNLLLPLEGDIYDDVDYAGDVYDNDSLHNDN